MLFSNADLIGGFFLLSWLRFASAKPTACVTNDQNDGNCRGGVQKALILKHLALPFSDGALNMPPLNDKLERLGRKARLEGSSYVNFGSRTCKTPFLTCPQLGSESCPRKPNAQNRGYVHLKWRATISYALAKHDDCDGNPDSRYQSGHQPGAQP